MPWPHSLLSLRSSRTVARAQQLEAEENNGARRSTSEIPGVFTDDPEEQEATATLLRDDQIDFLDPEAARDSYQDEFSEDEDDPFSHHSARQVRVNEVMRSIGWALGRASCIKVIKSQI